MDFASVFPEKVIEKFGRGIYCFGEDLSAMDKTSFENKLKELAGEFGAYNRQNDALAKAVKSSDSQSDKDFDSLEDSLDFLRIAIKYLRFDLESTRRENKYLRRLLEELDD